MAQRHSIEHALAFLQQREQELIAASTEIARLRVCLQTIADYGTDGICPYGCDTPNIARSALDAETTQTDE